MKTYQSHKTVQAAKVIAAEMDQSTGGARLSLEGGATEAVSRDWLIKHGEQGVYGGYFVRYPGDGYTSWSPASAFENGYTELGAEVAGLPVAGYKPTQSAGAIAFVNELKQAEERALRLLDQLDMCCIPEAFETPAMPAPDLRWVSIARTDIQKGFMAAARAVFQPGRVALPEDAQPDASAESAP